MTLSELKEMLSKVGPEWDDAQLVIGASEFQDDFRHEVAT